MLFEYELLNKIRVNILWANSRRKRISIFYVHFLLSENFHFSNVLLCRERKFSYSFSKFEKICCIKKGVEDYACLFFQKDFFMEIIVIWILSIFCNQMAFDKFILELCPMWAWLESPLIKFCWKSTELWNSFKIL